MLAISVLPAKLVADGLNNQALSLLDLGRIEEAEQLWQQARAADPHHATQDDDGGGKRLTKFTDVRLLRRMLRDVQHRNHSPLLTLLHWHYVRAGELFSIIPLNGTADHVVNGGFPFDLPALKPFFIGANGQLYMRTGPYLGGDGGFKFGSE